MGIVNNAVNGSMVQYTRTAIDGTTPGTYTLFTTLPGTQNFYITAMFFISTNLTGVPAAFTADLGFNGPSYDNYSFGGTYLFTATGNYQFDTGNNNIPPVPPSTPFVLNITAGSTSTTYETAVVVIGYYLL